MAREKFPSDDVDRLMVRFPPGMRERLKAEAEANKRSMNAEIVARLEASLSSPTAATTNFDAHAESLMRLTAAEIAVRSMQATIAMAQALEGKSDAERRRVMAEAIEVVHRDHLDKLTAGFAKDTPKPD